MYVELTKKQAKVVISGYVDELTLEEYHKFICYHIRNYSYWSDPDFDSIAKLVSNLNKKREDDAKLCDDWQ